MTKVRFTDSRTSWACRFDVVAGSLCLGTLRLYVSARSPRFWTMVLRRKFALTFCVTVGSALVSPVAQDAQARAAGLVSQAPLPAPVTQGTKIAVVVDGPAELYDAATLQLAKEIRVLIQERYPNWEVPNRPNFVGDFSRKGARRELLKALADPQIGLVIGLGIDVARAAGKIKNFNKPLLLPFAAPEFQGLPRSGKTSGRRNFAYLSGIVSVKRELEAFVDLTKERKVVMLLDGHYLEGSDNLPKRMQALVGKIATLKAVSSGKTAAQALRAIPEGTKAVYIGPLLRMPSKEYPALVRGLNERGIASYASDGRAWVEMGALMTLVPDDDFKRRLRKLALYVDSTIGGEDPGTFSTDYASRSVLLINTQTARSVGVHPTYAQLSDAELIGDRAPQARGARLELKDAVEQALRTNLELMSTREDAPIARLETQEAQAALYPTASLGASYTQVLPESKAIMSFARTGTWNGSIDVPLYTAMGWANRAAKLKNEKAIDQGIRTKVLDIVAQTATAYVNVLRAKNAEEINRQNLTRIRRNLEMAKVRVELGAAGRQELFRWQIEISDAKANVIRSEAVTSQSEIQLNRLINRPLETPVVIGGSGSQHLGLVVDPRVQPFVQDPFSFRIFREFMVQESVANAPEIQQLNASLASMGELRKGQKRDLWIPNAFARLSVSQNFYLDGAPAAFSMPAGAGGPAQPGAGGDAAQPEAPAFEFPKTPIWNVGVNLAWTAFDFRRNKRLAQTDRRMIQMKRQRSTLSQGIEQRVRSAMHQAGASGGVVELRNRAATAARSNFELVTDAYAKGTVGIITLVDAQNQALQTELAAANALYDWLIDFVEVQRASGVFTFLESERDHSLFVNRLKEFYRAHEGRPAPQR